MTEQMRLALETPQLTPSLQITPCCLRILVRRFSTLLRMRMPVHLQSLLNQASTMRWVRL
jgi:hypothetical protein